MNSHLLVFLKAISYNLREYKSKNMMTIERIFVHLFEKCIFRKLFISFARLKEWKSYITKFKQY